MRSLIEAQLFNLLLTQRVVIVLWSLVEEQERCYSIKGMV